MHITERERERGFRHSVDPIQRFVVSFSSGNNPPPSKGENPMKNNHVRSYGISYTEPPRTNQDLGAKNFAKVMK